MRGTEEHFLRLRKLVTDGNLNWDLRYRMVKCYVCSVLLYGVETWTLKASIINKIEAFEIWILPVYVEGLPFSEESVWRNENFSKILRKGKHVTSDTFFRGKLKGKEEEYAEKKCRD